MTYYATIQFSITTKMDDKVWPRCEPTCQVFHGHMCAGISGDWRAAAFWN